MTGLVEVGHVQHDEPRISRLREPQRVIDELRGQVAAFRPFTKRDTRSGHDSEQLREVCRPDDDDLVSRRAGDIHQCRGKLASLVPVRGDAADRLRCAGQDRRPVRKAQGRLRHRERQIAAVRAQGVEPGHRRARNVFAQAVHDYEYNPVHERRPRRGFCGHELTGCRVGKVRALIIDDLAPRVGRESRGAPRDSDARDHASHKHDPHTQRRPVRRPHPGASMPRTGSRSSSVPRDRSARTMPPPCLSISTGTIPTAVAPTMSA